MTLRSQLHSRRMELTEQIFKEDRIVDGSQKLFDVITDAHVKDQVALEKSFSESKIKTFQAELSKINSSLTAYQAEGCVYINNTYGYVLVHSIAWHGSL